MLAAPASSVSEPPSSRRAWLRSCATMVCCLGIAAVSPSTWAQPGKEPVSLLNVSYDVSREFYKDVNLAWEAHQRARLQRVDSTVTQSHGGSSSQARAVADGLDADVVTMNTATDLDFLAERGVVAQDWRRRLPHQAAPTTSTMIFLVREGNPKNIRDWTDLVRSDVKVVMVNPKTGGNGRMAYLSAWGAQKAKGLSDEQTVAYMTALYRNVPVLARGGRDATGAFLQRRVGDVLVTFESEVVSVNREFGDTRVDLVYPTTSLLTENPVAVVERTVAKRGTGAQARAYLEFLYSDAVQELAVAHGMRPRTPAVLAKHADKFRPLELFSVEKYFGSWSQAQQEHFRDGGRFDQLYGAR